MEDKVVKAFVSYSLSYSYAITFCIQYYGNVAKSGGSLIWPIYHPSPPLSLLSANPLSVWLDVLARVFIESHTTRSSLPIVAVACYYFVTIERPLQDS